MLNQMNFELMNDRWVLLWWRAPRAATCLTVTWKTFCLATVPLSIATRTTTSAPGSLSTWAFGSCPPLTRCATPGDTASRLSALGFSKPQRTASRGPPSLRTTMIAPSTNRAARPRGPWNRQPTRLKDGATTASSKWAKTHRDRRTIWASAVSSCTERWRVFARIWVALRAKRRPACAVSGDRCAIRCCAIWFLAPALSVDSIGSGAIRTAVAMEWRRPRHHHHLLLQLAHLPLPLHRLLIHPRERWQASCTTDGSTWLGITAAPILTAWAPKASTTSNWHQVTIRTWRLQ